MIDNIPRERIKFFGMIDRGINETPIYATKRLVCICLPLETYHIRLSSILFSISFHRLCDLTIVAYS